MNSHFLHSTKKKPIAVFCDFDGTIAHPDTLNFLAESFAGVEFRRTVGHRIVSGEISLREGIRQEVAVIRGSLQEVQEFLRKQVEIDGAFPPFAHWCVEQQVPLTIVSGGMKQVIEHLLQPYKLEHVRILANRVYIEGGEWRLEFLDETPWGHDKGAALHAAKQEGYRTVFAGDGLSDRGAAAEADVVFAKSGLARYCDDLRIPYHAFDDFSEVQKIVESL